MAVYVATVPSPAPPSVVFRYMADFRSCATWDPSVKSATLLSEGDPVQQGARFHVNAGGIPLDYETTELVPDSKIVLYAKNALMVSLDTITVAPRADGGSDMTYHATVELRGVFKLASPLLNKAFNGVGDRAKAGLEKALADLPVG
jgi:hypothetical protein